MVSENNKLEEKLILENMALIRKVIKDLHLYWQTEDEFQEYYDVGLDGLIKGVRSYDETKGKISTWCIPCIKNEILHLVTQKNYKKYKNEFGQDVSLYSVVPGSDSLEIIDTVEDSRIDIETDLEKKLEAERLLVAVNQLKNEKDKLVVKMYYGLDNYEAKTMLEISRIMGCTHQAIKIRKDRSLEKLRKYMIANDRDIFVKKNNKNVSKKEVKVEQSQNTKKTNTLSNLNDILFAQLERLNDASNDDVAFEKEIRKSYATAQLAQQIVSNNNTCIKALKLAKEHKIDNCDQLKFIGLK